MMRRQQQQQHQHQDQYSRVFFELSTLVFNLLRSPPATIPFADQLDATAPPLSVSSSSRSRQRSPPQSKITPAGFASLLLGVSLAMMLCGSVTFFIGFMLMPWVLGLVMVFYVAGIVSMISMLGRSLFCYATGPDPLPPPHHHTKEIPAWKLM
ncbi:hypothetical protein LINGRAHAP2_LOCUS18273 [Linum grandiflorum]